jgi:PTS system beta-glucosides-specific IIC component
MHNGFAPIMMQTLSKYGVDYILGLNVASNSAQAGATFAVFLKTKNKAFKSLAGVAALNAILGITEPALFGVTSRLKKPLIAVSIGGGVGGAIAAFFKVQSLGIATGPIIGIPLFIGPTFIYFVISCTVACILGFVIAYVIGFEDIPEKASASAPSPVIEDANATEAVQSENIASPVEGKVIALGDVNDAVFAGKIVGDGLAVEPTIGKVLAPFDGVVLAAPETKHAIGLRSRSGAELLIHVGLDTVQLNGEGYTSHVHEGDTVAKGDLLLEFDIDAIKNAGYEITTPIVVTNMAAYQSVGATPERAVKAGDALLTLTAKQEVLV